MNLLGDEEGFLSLRAGARFWMRSKHLELRVAPELQLDGGCEEDPVCGGAPLREALVGLHMGGFALDFGIQDREAGPGARGNVVLGRDMAPWPAGTARYERASRWGLWAVETGVGVLPGEREDVALPGLMHMDFRWSPHPLWEMGLTRATMFGGEGRPLPTLWDLLIPSQPHVKIEPMPLVWQRTIFCLAT